jgi:hypothetical protein
MIANPRDASQSRLSHPRRLNGALLRRRTISRFQLRQFDRLVWLFSRIDRYLPWSPTSLIAVGRKKKNAGDRSGAGGPGLAVNP